MSQGEKIQRGEGKDAPLEHVERAGHGGARRVASREPEPGEGPGTSPQVSAILSDDDAAQALDALDRLDRGEGLRRRDLKILRVAGRASLAARQWRDHLGDELGRINYEVGTVISSVNALRASVIGTTPEAVVEEDLEEEVGDAD